jgi:hypothetical protein
MERCGLDLTDSGSCPKAGSCQHGNELSEFIIDGKRHSCLRNYQLLFCSCRLVCRVLITSFLRTKCFKLDNEKPIES